MENKEDKERQAEELVNKFKHAFNEQFGTIPFVRYTIRKNPSIPLGLIEDCANKVLNGLGVYYYEDGISSVFHDNDVLLCRWIYYKIAAKTGYSKTQMATAIKQTPASVGYGLGQITKIIKQNGREKETFEKVKELIEKTAFRAFENDGDTDEGRTNSGGPATPA